MSCLDHPLNLPVWTPASKDELRRVLEFQQAPCAICDPEAATPAPAEEDPR